MYLKKYYAISFTIMLGMTGCGGGGLCGASVAFGAFANNTCSASNNSDVLKNNEFTKNNSSAAVVTVVVTNN